MYQNLTDFHGKSQRFEIFATISSKYLNSIVYYLSITYTSIITTESIVTIWMNRRNAFSGNSFTMRIPSKAPMLITGSISVSTKSFFFVCACKVNAYFYNIVHYVCVMIAAKDSLLTFCKDSRWFCKYTEHYYAEKLVSLHRQKIIGLYFRFSKE